MCFQALKALAGFPRCCHKVMCCCCCSELCVGHYVHSDFRAAPEPMGPASMISSA